MGESNSIYYIVGFIVVAHFVIGFGILVYKINKSPSSNEKQEEDSNGNT